MTPKHLLMTASLVTLAACNDASPTYNGVVIEEEEETDPDAVDVNGESRDELLPGTNRPDNDRSILRREAREEEASENYITFVGSGFIEAVAYNADTDTFEVDNIAFDGDNSYGRLSMDIDGTGVGRLGGYDVFAADLTVPDAETGTPVSQLDYRAVYGQSSRTGTNGEPLTTFAIVRTGDYIPYGFGGFVYERNGTVTIPNVDTRDAPVDNQATYRGDYAGLRVHDGGVNDLEYVSGDIQIDIDFEDFNDDEADVQGDGIKGYIFNRVAYDRFGNVIPTGGEETLELPVVTFTIGPGQLDLNGEVVSDLQSSIINDDGELELYEQGKFYAVLAGDNAEEIVGVVVLESQDPRPNGGTTLETGGFIAER